MPEADRSGLSATVAAAQEDPDSLPPEINTNVAHSARVYNYWLGGKDNFTADRALGDAIIKAVPSTVFGARANRALEAREQLADPRNNAATDQADRAVRSRRAGYLTSQLVSSATPAI